MKTIEDILIEKNELKGICYHSTFTNIENLSTEYSPFGLHIGTKDSAMNRIGVKIEESRRIGIPLPDNGENPYLLQVKITANNPLILKENRTGGWTPFDVLRAVMDQHESIGVKGFNEEDIELYYEDAIEHNGVKLVDLDVEDYGGESYNTEVKESRFIRDWIESKGYDSILYNNEFEGGGHSIIVLRDEQVEVVNKTQLNPEFKPKQRSYTTKNKG